MTDLRERFEILDELDVPDLRSDIASRPSTPIDLPKSRSRLAAAAVAAMIAVVGLALVLRAFLGTSPQPTPAEEPDFTVPTPGRVEEVLEVERFPGGLPSKEVPGDLVARVQVGARVWELSVSYQRDGEVSCMHLSRNPGCHPVMRGIREALGRFTVERSTVGEVNPLTGKVVTLAYGEIARRFVEVSVEFSDGTRVTAEPIEGPATSATNFYFIGVLGTPALSVASMEVVDRHGRVEAFSSMAPSWIHTPPSAGGVLDVPERGEALPAELDDGRPVFVVHHEDGQVSVVDGFSTHEPFGIRKIIGWCERSRWFEDPFHGSAFNEFGVYRDGPAPTGLLTYEVTPLDAGHVRVVGVLPPTTRDTPGGEPAGPFCSGAAPTAGAPLLHPVIEPVDSSLAEIVASSDGWVGVRAALHRDSDGALLCQPGSGGECVGGLPVHPIESGEKPRTHEGVWLIEVRAGKIVGLAVTPEEDYGQPL